MKAMALVNMLLLIVIMMLVVANSKTAHSRYHLGCLNGALSACGFSAGSCSLPQINDSVKACMEAVENEAF